MSVEDNKAIVRRFFDEVWNEGNREAIQELVDNDWLPRDPALAHIQPRSGTTGISTFMEVYRSAFPDLKFTIQEIVTEGDIVVTRFEAQGTNSGEEIMISLLGNRNFTIAPTGRTVKTSGVSMSRVVISQRTDVVVRQIKDHSWYWHGIGLLEALAVIQLRERVSR
ncbi:MAG: ester cyclase [Anderseniella sp.]|jgi:predicted ester cyclase|nr:ester cyclase [Anderseniella sp.]